MTVVINGTTGFTGPQADGDATINGLTVGKGLATVSTNTAVGVSALAANTSGATNTAVGNTALQANTTGINNSALGHAALVANLGGSENSAYGSTALVSNTSGSSNTAVGRAALYSNTTASNNTAVGFQAAYSNVTGANITAIGNTALYSNTANDNTAVGTSALYLNTTGTCNVAIGTGISGVAYGPLRSNVSGNYNVAVGNSTLPSSTTSNNTAVGHQALYSNTTGDSNTAVGAYAGLSVSTGGSNAFFGYYAGRGVTGSLNTCIGYGAGYYSINYQGSYSILIGANTDANASGDTNELVIGYQAKGKGSNTGFISMGAVSIYQGNNSGSWATTSDQRIKKNIVDVASGLSVITALRPVEFDYKENDIHEIGFIAQEYQQVLPDQIVKHAPNDAEKEWVEDGEVLGIQPNLVPYLVKAIQELKTQVDAQAAEIAALKGQA